MKTQKSPAVAVVNQQAEETVGSLPTPGDWRDYLKPQNWHSASLLFPLLRDVDPEAAEELAKDIKLRGLLNPIIIYQGKVLDGRNRLFACDDAEVEPRFLEWEPSGGMTPVEYVVSQNFHRRHLTPDQRAALAAQLVPQLEREAKERQAAQARRPRDEGGRLLPLPHKNGEVGEGKDKHAGEAVVKASRMTGVNPNKVRQARNLQKENPQAFQQVKAGTQRLTRSTVGPVLKETERKPKARPTRSVCEIRIERALDALDALLMPDGHASTLPLSLVKRIDGEMDGHIDKMQNLLNIARTRLRREPKAKIAR
jgi:ParB-like chromosome segregation protein Spo0J